MKLLNTNINDKLIVAPHKSKGIKIYGQVVSSWGYLHECVRAWGGLFS